MTVAGQAPATAGLALRVRHEGAWYPAEEVAKGAAYELFAPRPDTGFLVNPRPGAQYPYRRFVHATEVEAVSGPVTEAHDGPLHAPVSRVLDWRTVHRMSQAPAGEDSAVAAIRRTATVRRGTRMLKVLSARQLAGYLRGWLPCGFCYREYDLAHLRTPADLAVLLSDSGGAPGEVVFALRWRAVGPGDYEIPSTEYRGLVTMPPHDRVGPPVIGSGFAPASQRLIPEFVTADLADLPLTANASLIAYTSDGTEVTLYSYLPEQRAWTRMFGPQWRHLVAGVPGSSRGPFPADQEYLPTEPAPSRFVGQHNGEVYEAIADPPGEFRVLAKTRAARYPVERLARRCAYGTWRGATCTIVRAENGWLRIRLCRPDGESVARLGAHCVERGVYETWAPAAEVTDARTVDIPYDL
jgi:hypothetical protein